MEENYNGGRIAESLQPPSPHSLILNPPPQNPRRWLVPLCRSLESAIKLAERFIAGVSRHSPATADVTKPARPAAGSQSGPAPSTLNAQPSTSFLLSAPMPVVEREETKARTELGAAQKDTARELGAKLSSLKGIVWVGVGLFVFGLASLVYPPLKVVIASVTTSAALMLGGLALMILPTLVVGNELLILGGVGVAVGGWFLAHRHGQLKGEVSSLKSKV